MVTVRATHLLAACHGYAVYASDGLVGEVETPLFPPDSATPDFIMLRITCRGRLFPRFVSLPIGAVVEADVTLRRLTVATERQVLEALPSNVPIPAAAEAELDDAQRRDLPARWQNAPRGRSATGEPRPAEAATAREPLSLGLQG